MTNQAKIDAIARAGRAALMGERYVEMNPEPPSKWAHDAWQRVGLAVVCESAGWGELSEEDIAAKVRNAWLGTDDGARFTLLSPEQRANWVRVSKAAVAAA